MKKKVIGFYGATGSVGAGAVRILQNYDYEVRIARHKNSKGGNKPVTLKQGWTETEVDALDLSAGIRFVKDCDVVLNCAGPAAVIYDKVARACLRAGVPYVDASLDVLVADELKTVQEKQDVDLVLGAGTMPGLAEMLIADIAREDVLNAAVYVDLRGTVSASAVYDILMRMQSQQKNGQLSACISDGQVMQVRELTRRIDLGEYGGEADTLMGLYISEELSRRAAEIHGTLRCYSSSTAAMMKKDILKLMRENCEDKWKLAGRIADCLNTQGGEYALMAAEVKKTDGTRERQLLCYDGPSAKLTGMVAAATMLLLSEGRVHGGGCRMADMAVDIADVLDIITVSEKCTYKRWNV